MFILYLLVVTKANHFGSGLRQMGLSKGANFAIYLDTRSVTLPSTSAR